MKALFGYDGPVINFLSKVGDCVLLSLLWILFSLPVITLGAATTGLYHAVRKILREDQNGIFAHFWEAFRDNFRQCAVITLVLLLTFGILGMSAYSAWLLYEAGQVGAILPVLLGIILALAVTWALYLFPCVDRFRSTTRRILSACAQVAGINIFWSLALLLLFCLSVALTVMLPVGLAVMPAAGMFGSSIILEHVFKKYMETDDEDTEAEDEEET